MADYNDVTTVEIEGLEELEEAFTAGSERAVKKFLRRVEMRAAKILVTSAQENAPFDRGDLSEDIHRQTIIDADGMTVRVGPSKETFYGLFEEFGAPNANIPAQHWLENSAREVQSEVMDEYVAAINEGLEDMKR